MSIRLSFQGVMKNIYSITFFLFLVGCSDGGGRAESLPGPNGVNPPASVGASSVSVENVDPQYLLEALKAREEWKKRFTPNQKVDAESLGRKVFDAISAPGFHYVNTKQFNCGGQKHWIVIAKHKRTGLNFSLIPGGSFLMGQVQGQKNRFRRGLPQKKLTVEPFLLCQTEVPNSIYRVLRPEHDSGHKQGLSLNDCKQPVSSVTFEEASEWCHELGLRLPSEVEWEYAMRAGTTSLWFWGDSDERASLYANEADYSLKAFDSGYCPDRETDDGYAFSSPVASFLPNAFGLFDMIGNVAEWVADNWYERQIIDYRSPGPELFGRYSYYGRVWRGGSWQCWPGFSTDKVFPLRSVWWSVPSLAGTDIGFRPAASIILGK